MAEQNLSVLFNTLADAKETKNCDGGYNVSQLTLTQQKELIATVFDPFEAPLKTTMAFNKIIANSVVKTDPDARITVLERPYLLREIHDLVVGTKFTKKVNGDIIDYEFTENSFKDVQKIKHSETIELNPFIKINLSAPSLAYDSLICRDLANTIDSYRRQVNRNSKIDEGYIAGLYYIFEIIKFVESIIVNDTIYSFADMSANERRRGVEDLPKPVSDKIVSFIEKIKKAEDLAFTAKNLKTGETETITIAPGIFSKEL